MISGNSARPMSVAAIVAWGRIVFIGPTGEELMRRLIEQAPQYLEPHGLLALEIGINQSEGLADFLRQKNYHDIQSKKDYAGITRFLLARYG